MPKLNAVWHHAHVMPKNATEAQRAKWHFEHAKHCGCRAVTASIAKLMKEHGYAPPKAAGTTRPSPRVPRRGRSPKAGT